MWYQPPKYLRPITDVNQDLKKLEGVLEDKEAQITLAKFLYRNLGFTTYFLTGISLYPDQIITIKSFMQNDFSLCVWGRGVSKTWTAAVYCILQCIFEPKSSILVAGPTFCTARFIFNHIEKICESPEAKMLAAAMGKSIHRNDEFRWNINGGEIVAIPLNGEKIRGFRANVLLIDEFLLMPEDLVEKVLIPYLVVPKDLTRRKLVREREDDLIQRGILNESQRTVFANTQKMIALSSASYTCEYLYKKYTQYKNMIYDAEKDELGATYFISQLSWDSIPQDRMDKSIIKLASSNTSQSANFQREYCGQFVDGSDSYFSMKKMLTCTVPDGQNPTLLLRGGKDRKYILAIDPNASNSSTSDDFAMCVLELEEAGDKTLGTIVHSYAESGRDLKDHIKYLHYIMTNFNIEMILIDHAGYQFIEAANESELFRRDKLSLKIFEFSAEKDGPEYQDELKKAKRAYNKTIGRIVYTQYFTTDFILKGNEWLQGCFDFQKIWFGGCIKGNESALNKAIASGLNPKDFSTMEKWDKDETPINYLIDLQEELLAQTRYQCAAIEAKVSARGVMSFDLPDNMKKDKTSGRMRRDSYTALMLAAWLMRCYHDISHAPDEQQETFEPFLV